VGIVFDGFFRAGMISVRSLTRESLNTESRKGFDSKVSSEDWNVGMPTRNFHRTWKRYPVCDL
jgi:hypothetical protein